MPFSLEFNWGGHNQNGFQKTTSFCLVGYTIIAFNEKGVNIWVLPTKQIINKFK